ncbi:nucleoside monophosphate kinase [Patescibacteria group bacterium]|nr:nucleoside monophosphate kinase [Patescibacteria group bacterium]MCH8889115.1 nucleoside monophosphate kinase [Patescibacteria group bacterium]
MELQTVIFYGRSGSGKGTQAELLQKYIEKNDPKRRVLYLQTGAILRELAKQNTHTAKMVKKILEEGGLLPAFLSIWAWGTFFMDKYTGGEHLLLDGVTRRVDEVPVLDGALKFYGKDKNPDVVILNVSRETAVKYLMKRGRYDDNEDDINERLDWFEENVIPTLDFFKNNLNYNIHEIDGEKSIEEVHEQLIKSLGI